MKRSKFKYKISSGLIVLAAGAAGVLALASGAYASFSAIPDSDDQIGVTMGNVQVSLIEDLVNRGDHGAHLTENNKKFWVLARGTKETIVRAKIVCSAEYYPEGSTQGGADYTANPITELNNAPMEYDRSGNPTADSPFTYKVKSSNNWIYNPADGYWYYTRILNQGGLEQEISVHAGTGTKYPANDDGSGYTVSTTDPIILTDILIARHNHLSHPNEVWAVDSSVTGCNEHYAKYIRQDTRINVHVDVEGVQATNGAYLLSWGDVDNWVINQIGVKGGQSMVAADRDTAIKNETRLPEEDRVLTKIYRQ